MTSRIRGTRTGRSLSEGTGGENDVRLLRSATPLVLKDAGEYEAFDAAVTSGPVRCRQPTETYESCLAGASFGTYDRT
jgi:hypothetical protein